MKNKHLISASAQYFVETNEIEVSQWDTYHLLKYAALDIVPKRHSNILFEAINSVELTDLQLNSLVELIEYQIDIYARQMTAECIKYCIDFVEKYYKTNGLNELVCNCDDALSAHYQAYNNSQTSEPIDLLV